jgi:hypothetical protein
MNIEPILVEEFTPPQTGEEVIMGTYSHYWRKPHPKREILRRYAITVDGITDTPTHHAREYLKSHYKGKHICKKAQYQTLKMRSMPIYAIPSSHKEGAYVDIKSAWWAILNITGWDCDYWPGKWFSRGVPPLDFPLPGNKVARSALVSLAISNSLPVWVDGHIKMVATRNELENHHIYGVIADVLGVIAETAVHAYGACYVASDGFILPLKRACDLIDYIRSWGLDAQVKYCGATWVMGVGSYIVGPHQSRRPASGRPYSNLRQDLDPDWLQRRVVWKSTHL